MVRQGHYQTLVPYGYNADIVVNIVKERGRSTGNRWRLTVDDAVVSLKHSSYWSSKADAVAKAFGEDKEFRTRTIPNKKKDYTKPSWEDMYATRKEKTT